MFVVILVANTVYNLLAQGKIKQKLKPSTPARSFKDRNRNYKCICAYNMSRE